VAGVNRRRSGVTTARVELAVRPGDGAGVGAGDLVVDAPHDEAGLLSQLAAELAGLPVPSRKRLLGDQINAVANRIDAVGRANKPVGQASKPVGQASKPAARASGPGQASIPAARAAAETPQHGDHDLVGCLARLLAANLLTVEEFESKRRHLAP
jgi:hypothetical protein